ncbi:unnamed protein product, partial [Ceratitis capitata]
NQHANNKQQTAISSAAQPLEWQQPSLSLRTNIGIWYLVQFKSCHTGSGVQ